MLKLQDVKIDAKTTVGAPLVLCRVQPTVAYEGGMPTAHRDGTRFTVACPGADMRTLAVKVPGPQALDLEDSGITFVDFDGLEIYSYFKEGKVYVAGRAKAIRRVDVK